jgi:hypothetical protein
VQYTNEKAQDKYTKTLEENIFLTMELGKQQYSSIIEMPVKRLENYLTWKIKFDEDTAKSKAENLEQI